MKPKTIVIQYAMLALASGAATWAVRASAAEEKLAFLDKMPRIDKSSTLSFSAYSPKLPRQPRSNTCLAILKRRVATQS